jgi:phosphoribosyl-ATP pyrophosphohydrolase
MRLIEDSPTAGLFHEADGLRSFERSPLGRVAEASPYEISRLYASLDFVDERAHPRTAQLLASGVPKMAQKVVEEAVEVAIEATRRRGRAVVRESADLLYNLVVLWRGCGVEPKEVWTEMNQRATALGIAEKLPKRPKNRSPGSKPDPKDTDQTDDEANGI